jgi:hypothetical protein
MTVKVARCDNNVRFGTLADITKGWDHIRFTPDGGHQRGVVGMYAAQAALAAGPHFVCDVGLCRDFPELSHKRKGPGSDTGAFPATAEE